MIDVVKVRDSNTGRVLRLDVECPVHGAVCYPPDSGEAVAFAVQHEDCEAIAKATGVAGRPRRRVRAKSRRSALPAGLAPFLAPSPILLELGQPVLVKPSEGAS